MIHKNESESLALGRERDSEREKKRMKERGWGGEIKDRGDRCTLAQTQVSVEAREEQWGEGERERQQLSQHTVMWGQHCVLPLTCPIMSVVIHRADPAQ